ncbi:alpha/beta hydrolase [Parashewanella curva]|nr:alpha/beta fold hydrolase [Parashewanella curva]
MEISSFKFVMELNKKEGKQYTDVRFRKSRMPRYNGTVVLFHGFGANKVTMLMTAMYFRTMGFNVLIPDLLGHGESSGKTSFGVRDAEIINEIIDAQLSDHIKGKPIISLGQSLGAYAAMHLAKMRSDVDGILLMAPVADFNKSAIQYVRVFKPPFSSWLSDEDVRQAAQGAISDSNVETNALDMLSLIEKTVIPTLIMTSEIDRITNSKDFAELQGNHIKQVIWKMRAHVFTSAIDPKTHIEVMNWLDLHIKKQPYIYL